MRVLGIDYGDSRIGFSISDPLGIIASELGVHQNKSMRTSIDYAAGLISVNEISCVVLGLPFNMDGSEGDRASKTRAFGKNLEKVSGVAVIYQDERLTSCSAARILNYCGVSKKKQQQLIDTKSAQIILQTYLDKNSRR